MFSNAWRWAPHARDVWALPRVSQEGRVFFCMVQTPDVPAVGKPREVSPRWASVSGRLLFSSLKLLRIRINDGSSQVKLCRYLKRGCSSPLGSWFPKHPTLYQLWSQACVRDPRSRQGTEGEAKRQNRRALY